jgi:hypothetical protein
MSTSVDMVQYMVGGPFPLRELLECSSASLPMEKLVCIFMVLLLMEIEHHVTYF